jgi:hypothetical protein
MLLAAIVLLGILTLWVPARWGLAAFQLALFTLAAARMVFGLRSGPRIVIQPVMLALAGVAGWGAAQLLAGWSVDPARTGEEVLNWIANAAAFALAVELAEETRERFLNAVLIFSGVLAVAAMLTVFSSPPGVVLWSYDAGTQAPTLGPFVYRNQYAAFVEAVLPLALARAMLDRRPRMLYVLLCALLFASVVAGGSRTGSMLCLAEIILLPVLARWRGLGSPKALATVTLATLTAVAATTAVAGWEPLWRRLQEPNAYVMRSNLLRSSIRMLAERPVTGFGLGAWPSVYPGFALYDDGSFVNQAHTDWAQWAAEGGIPLVMLLFFAAASLVRPALRCLWGVGILTVFLHCLVDYPMQQRPALAAFFFGLAGVVAGAGESRKK